MFDLSSKTQVNKSFRLSELYKLMAADKSVKEDGKKIASVTLLNVLNKDTMNLPSDGEVKEIYVFQIVLLEKIVPVLFLSSLDKAINLHTIFILKYNDLSCLYGCYKERTEKGVKLGRFYQTNWSTDNIVQIPLTALSLDNVYTKLIDTLIPIEARPNEDTKSLVARYETLLSLEKEMERLQKQVDNEKQPKKRFEYNARLKELKKIQESIK